MPKLLIDPEAAECDQKIAEAWKRIWKLKRYCRHFDIRRRYEISFKEFVRRVENGTWQAYLAE